jgi:large repetitive protein
MATQAKQASQAIQKTPGNPQNSSQPDQPSRAVDEFVRSKSPKAAPVLLAQVTLVNPEFADELNDVVSSAQDLSQVSRLRLIDLIEPTLHDEDRPGAVRIAEVDDSLLSDQLSNAGASGLVALAPVAAVPWAAMAGVAAVGTVGAASGAGTSTTSASSAATTSGSTGNANANAGAAGTLDSVASDNVINAREASESTAIGGRGVSANAQLSVKIKQFAADGVTVIREVTVDSVDVHADGTWQLPIEVVAQLGDGQYSVTAITVSAQGDRAEATQSFAIDRSAPAAPAVLAISGVVTDTTPSIAGINALQGDHIQVVSPTGEIMNTAVAADGSWSVTPTIELAAGGPRSFVISASDDAGNISAPTFLAVSITPVVVLSAAIATNSDSGTPGDSLTNQTRPTLTGTGKPGASLTIATSAGEVLSTTVGDDGHWRASLNSALAEGGPQKISVSSVDANGITTSVSVPIIVDTTAPLAVTAALKPGSDSGVIGDYLTNDSTPSLFGAAASPGDIVRVTSPTGEIMPTIVGLDGRWSVTPAIALPGSGSQEFQITVSDAAGNAGPTSTLVLSLDTIAPAAPQAGLDLAYAQGATVSGHTLTNKPTISGHGAAPDSLITVVSPIGEIMTVTPFADGTWCVTVQNELASGGPYAFRVTAGDSAGNVSPITTVSVIVDAPLASEFTTPFSWALSTPGATTFELVMVNDSLVLASSVQGNQASPKVVASEVAATNSTATYSTATEVATAGHLTTASGTSAFISLAHILPNDGLMATI